MFFLQKMTIFAAEINKPNKIHIKMAISLEQAKNYYQYCTLSPERSKLYLSLSLNQELSDFTIDTTEHAFYFAKAIALWGSS